MDKFLCILTTILLAKFCFSENTVKFLNDFFEFKNVRTIWQVACTRERYQMTADLLRQSKYLTAIHSVGATSERNPFPLDERIVQAVGLVIDMGCESLPPAINELFKNDGVSRKLVTLLWAEDAQISENILQLFPALCGNFTEVFYAQTNENSKDINIFNCRMTLLMKWSSVGGLRNLGIIERPLINKKTVKGIVSLREPARFKESRLIDILEQNDVDSIQDNLMKFSLVLHQMVAKMYGFEWQLTLLDPKLTGEIYTFANGSLNYIKDKSQFGLLDSAEVDIGLYPTEMLPNGLDIVEALPPLITFRQVFVFSHPITALEPHFIYTQFSGVVWGVSCFLAIITAIITLLAVNIHNSDTKEQQEFSFVTNVLIVVGAFSQQGLERTSEKTSIRLTQFSLLILSSLLMMFYSTGLLIYTLDPKRIEIETFEGLITRGYAIAAEDIPYIKFQLAGNYSHHTEPFYHNCATTWGTCKTEVEFYNLSTGIQKVKDEKVAFLGHESNVYGALSKCTTDRQQSDLREVIAHKNFLISTFVRKFFPYKELFSRGLLLLREAGILQHEDQTWILKKPDPLLDSYFIIASLYSTSVAFILLFVGFGLSAVELAFEIFLVNRKRRRGITFTS